MNDYPDVAIIKVRPNRTRHMEGAFLVTVGPCPYCGAKEHYHGSPHGVLINGRPEHGVGFGYRVSDCSPGGTYRLVFVVKETK